MFESRNIYLPVRIFLFHGNLRRKIHFAHSKALTSPSTEFVVYTFAQFIPETHMKPIGTHLRQRTTAESEPVVRECITFDLAHLGQKLELQNDAKNDQWDLDYP
jgi:hypothetical protein